jgi:hypothetical protein
MRKTRLFSYVVDHDTGHAPNPYLGFCTLCRCKYKKARNRPSNIVELAERGDWIVGTGGANKKKSAGHHKLVYAMKVERKLTRGDYFRSRTFVSKRPSGGQNDYRSSGDNLRPKNEFEDREQYVLISERHFYYFGDQAIRIPQKKLPHLEKHGPGFRSDFDGEYIRRFEKWITSFKPGKHGDPCKKHVVEERRAERCKSFC